MAVKKVNEIISEVLQRARQIETEDGESFMELEELRQWAAALVPGPPRPTGAPPRAGGPPPA